jgi:hypothetical protein
MVSNRCSGAAMRTCLSSSRHKDLRLQAFPLQFLHVSHSEWDVASSNGLLNNQFISIG